MYTQPLAAAILVAAANPAPPAEDTGPFAPHVNAESAVEILAEVRDAFEPPELVVGDQAPELKPVSWARGGGPRFGRGRVLVVDFWASWCAPCVAAMPGLSRLSEELSEAADFVAVNVREADPESGRMLDAAAPEMVDAFIADAGERLRTPVAIGDRAMDAAWIAAAGRSSLPTYAVVDRDGRLAWIGGEADALDGVVRAVVAGTHDTDAARERQLAAARVQHLGGTINQAAVQGNAEGDLSRFYELCAALSLAAEAHEGLYLASLMDTVLTHPLLDDRRDLDTAQRGSRLACELTEWSNAEVIRVHALATFMGGDAAGAVELGEQALRAADPDDEVSAARIRADIERFRSDG